MLGSAPPGRRLIAWCQCRVEPFGQLQADLTTYCAFERRIATTGAAWRTPSASARTSRSGRATAASGCRPMSSSASAKALDAKLMAISSSKRAGCVLGLGLARGGMAASAISQRPRRWVRGRAPWRRIGGGRGWAALRVAWRVLLAGSVMVRRSPGVTQLRPFPALQRAGSPAAPPPDRVDPPASGQPLASAIAALGPQFSENRPYRTRYQTLIEQVRGRTARRSFIQRMVAVSLCAIGARHARS